MITTDELKVQLAEHAKAVKDLEEALAIEASRKRVQELEHTMSRPGFYDDAELSKKVFDEVGDLKGKLNRFEKLQGLYDDAETMNRKVRIAEELGFCAAFFTWPEAEDIAGKLRW